MTEKLFALDSYCTRFSASVLSCEPASKNGMQGFAVKLDRTCFFPEGGGQPADTGCLQAGDQSAQVLYTYEQEEAIPACPGKPRLIHLHTLKGKGVSFMEGQVGWHGKAPNAEQTAQALSELEG